MDGYMQVFTQLSGNNCITVCYYTAPSSVPYCNPKNYFKRYKSLIQILYTFIKLEAFLKPQVSPTW